MKITSIILCAFSLVCSFTVSIYSSDLQFIPSESLGFVRISNIGKTIDTIVENAIKIDSSNSAKKNSAVQSIGLFIGVQINDRKELEDKLGMDSEGDLILFWPSTNWKTRATAYSIVDREKSLDIIKSSKGDPIQPVPVHEGIEIYIFNGKSAKQECFFFVDGYNINCEKESTARLIINCFKGKDKSINTDEKYLNFSKSIRKKELTVFINLDQLSRMFLPMVQMLSEGYSQQMTTNPKMQKKLEDQKIDQQQVQNIKNLYMKTITWVFEQFDDMGFSIGLDEEGLIVDSYIGFKKESKIQDYLVNKKDTLDHMKYIPENVIYVSNTKSNPEVMLDIITSVLEIFDSTIITMDSTNIQSWKESFLEQFKRQTSYLGYENSGMFMLSEDAIPLQFLQIVDVKDAQTAQNAAQEYCNTDVLTMNLLNKFSPGNTIQDYSEPIMEIKEVIDYKEVKITSMKYNNKVFLDLENDIPFGLSNLFIHHAVVKNKQILSFSESDHLIKQTIDSLIREKAKPMLIDSLSYKTAIKYLPENPDSISYLSVVSLLKVINRFAVLNRQKQCFDVMKIIETASAEYYNSTDIYPRKLDDMYNNKSLERLLKKKTCRSYALDKNTGKTLCETHGSLVKAFPLENVDGQYDNAISAWEGKTDGIGFSSKSQNYGISSSINIPFEIIKSASIAVKNKYQNKKAEKKDTQKVDEVSPEQKNVKEKVPVKTEKE